LRKITLKIFDLYVAVSNLGEHALDVSSQSVNTLGATLNASHTMIHLVQLVLQVQNFPLVHHELLPQLLRNLSVLLIALA
jgi:hypothetical protein